MAWNSLIFFKNSKSSLSKLIEFFCRTKTNKQIRKADAKLFLNGPFQITQQDACEATLPALVATSLRTLNDTYKLYLVDPAPGLAMPPIFREPDSEAWHHIIHPGSRGLRRLFVRWSFLQSGLVCVIEVGLVCMVVLSDFSELSSVTLCHHWQIRKLKISKKANISRNIRTTQVNPFLSLLQVVALF